MENDQEPRGSSEQPLKSWTQATKASQESMAETEHAPSRMETTVGWQDNYTKWHRTLFCPNCYHDVRVDLVLRIRDIDGIAMPYYTCKRCKCQFTRKLRFQDVIDKQERI